MKMCHWIAAMAILLCFTGCGSSGPTQKTAAELQAEIRAALAQLPAAEKPLAETQKVCPITGEPLGSMGVPPKLTLKGKVVFICCLACKGDVEADPDKALEKVNAAHVDGKK